MKFTLNRVEASEAGDYYQISFEEPESDGDDAPYLLLQCQLEFPDGRQCHMESNVDGLVGRFSATNGVLERDRLIIGFDHRPTSSIEVRFETTDAAFIDVVRILRIMIPSIEVKGPIPFAPIRMRLDALNDFLEIVFGEPTRLSDVLREQAITETQLQRLREDHLIEMLSTTCCALKDLLGDCLPPTHAAILCGRYCLDDWEAATAADLADRLGVSRSRIDELQKKAIQRFRGANRKALIKAEILKAARSLRTDFL